MTFRLVIVHLQLAYKCLLCAQWNAKSHKSNSNWRDSCVSSATKWGKKNTVISKYTVIVWKNVPEILQKCQHLCSTKNITAYRFETWRWVSNYRNLCLNHFFNSHLKVHILRITSHVQYNNADKQFCVVLYVASVDLRSFRSVWEYRSLSVWSLIQQVRVAYLPHLCGNNISHQCCNGSPPDFIWLRGRGEAGAGQSFRLARSQHRSSSGSFLRGLMHYWFV